MKFTWRPIMAGILDIVSGAIGMVGGLYFFVLSSVFRAIHQNLGVSEALIQKVEQFISSIFAVPFVLMFIGIITIIGGVYALQRRIWPLALVGSVFAFIVFPILGVFAIIFTSLAREEFN